MTSGEQIFYQIPRSHSITEGIQRVKQDTQGNQTDTNERYCFSIQLMFFLLIID
jgi:hypothetical protein